MFKNQYGSMTSKCLTPGCTYKQGHTNTMVDNDFRKVDNINTNLELIVDGKYAAILDRGLTENTCQDYLYQVGEIFGKTVHIANYLDSSGDIVSQKIRFLDDKTFIWRQDSHKKLLFGQHLIPVDTTNLFITEGELDALSLAELGLPAISISTGAGDQTEGEIKRHLEYLNGFERITLCFDMDKIGQETAQKIAKLLIPGRVFIAPFRYKDANEYLKNHLEDELIEDLAKAELYRPEAIVRITKQQLLTTEQLGLTIPYPQLNKAIKGIKPGRLYTLLAGSGIGKTSFTRELMFSLLQGYPDLKVGAVYLEDPVQTTGLSFIALENNIPLHELQDEPTQLGDKFDAAYEKYIESNRIEFVDASFMKLESKELITTLRYLVQGLGCKVIVLDHLTMVTYDMQGEQSERKDIDMLMKALRELVHVTRCSIILVSHLKRPQFGRSWAEGKEVQMTDCRGSAAIEQLSDVIIALERNMINDYEKSKTKVKVLKNRVTGWTGYVDELYFNETTGRLITVDQLWK